jgi:membrane fusion protein (multidrug efflux system)
MRKNAVLLTTLVCALACGSASAQEEAELDADATTCLLKPKQVIEVGSPVFGVLARVLVDRADKVKRGQVVARLVATVEEAQVAIDQLRAKSTTEIEAAKADLVWNQRSLDRKTKLRENEYASVKDVDDYQTKVEQGYIAIRKAEDNQNLAALEVARSEAQLNLKIIKSPVDGVVTDVMLSPGEYIYESTPIMTIAQVDPLNVDLVLPSSRYGDIKQGMKAKLHLTKPVDAHYAARVDAIDPIIDAASDTFRVRLELPNPDYAIPAGVRCSASLF